MILPTHAKGAISSKLSKATVDIDDVFVFAKRSDGDWQSIVSCDRRFLVIPVVVEILMCRFSCLVSELHDHRHNKSDSGVAKGEATKNGCNSVFPTDLAVCQLRQLRIVKKPIRWALYLSWLQDPILYWL